MKLTLYARGTSSALHSERDATLRLKGENGIMKKKFSALIKDIEEQKETLKSMAEKEEALHETMRSLQSDIAMHKADIKERDVIISGHECTMYELKADNRELEKFKFVLDHQIRELKTQIEPRERDIGVMKEQVRSRDGKLEFANSYNRSLQDDIGAIAADIASKQEDILVTARGRSHRKWQYPITCVPQLPTLVNALQSPNELRKRVIRLPRVVSRRQQN